MPLTKTLLIQLAETRLAEATHLFEARQFSGAYYLGGYAAELGLKACIAGAFQPGTIPEKSFVDRIYTHNLQKLVDLAGLEFHRIERSRADALFGQHWQLVREWSEGSRYAIWSERQARELLEALRDRDHGVFEWIRSHL